MRQDAHQEVNQGRHLDDVFVDEEAKRAECSEVHEYENDLIDNLKLDCKSGTRRHVVIQLGTPWLNQKYGH